MTARKAYKLVCNLGYGWYYFGVLVNCGVTVIKPVYVGEDYQRVGAYELCDYRRETVIVAVDNFLNAYCVVFVYYGNCAV